MVDKKADAKAEKMSNVEDDNDDPLNAPGFHVLANDSYVGTFQDKEQAQHYIDGHLTPQDMKAEIVEGPVAVEGE